MTATPGPESAAHNITAMRGRIHGIATAMAAGDTVHPDALNLALDALVAAVRHHDAETVLAQPDARKYGRGQWGADRIVPKATP